MVRVPLQPASGRHLQVKQTAGVTIEALARILSMKRVSLLVFAALLVLCFWTSAGFAQDDEGVFTKFDKVPIPVRTPPPEVPNDLKGQNGIVSVVVIIDEKGDVSQATISKSTDAAFEQASIDAVRKWKFKPAEVGGQAVRAKVTIPIRFSAAK